MVELGKKIRVLRRNKQISQAQLAEVLSVSAQSISKWENGLSAPDISLLPMLARYFGITMDELFGYRLDALNYKERFIRFLADNGMLRFGSFTLTSGRPSPYYIDMARCRSAAQISRLGEFFAECIRENDLETDLLAASAEKDVPGTVAAALTLHRKYGVDVGCCCVQTEDPPRQPGRVLLLKAVIATGDTAKAAAVRLREAGAAAVTVVTAVDRMEKSSGASTMATRELERNCGIRVCTVVTAADILRAVETGVIGGAEHLPALRAHLQTYGGTGTGEKAYVPCL